jgi:hypothetical protein
MDTIIVHKKKGIRQVIASNPSLKEKTQRSFLRRGVFLTQFFIRSHTLLLIGGALWMNISLVHSGRLLTSPNSSTLCAQVRRVLVSGRTQSRASSYFQECGNLLAKAANSLSLVVASAHLLAHRENAPRYWPQAASLATGNLRVPLVPRSQNRESHSFPVQVLYLLCSKARPQLNRAWCYVLALLHLDQRDALAIHQASIEALLSHFQAFEQALFFLNMEAQPSNEELPHLILPKFIYKPPNELRIDPIKTWDAVRRKG